MDYRGYGIFGFGLAYNEATEAHKSVWFMEGYFMVADKRIILIEKLKRLWSRCEKQHVNPRTKKKSTPKCPEEDTIRKNMGNAMIVPNRLQLGVGVQIVIGIGIRVTI